MGTWSGGCSDSGPDRDGPQAPAVDATPTAGEAVAASVRAGREIRIDSIIDRVHFAFRNKNGKFEAAHSTHLVSVDRGAVSVTPFQRADQGVVAGAPLALATTAIHRGDTPVDAAYKSASIDPETGRLAISRGQVTEVLKNFEGGLEQSWRFERAPSGQGDLVIEVTASGHQYIATTERGLHFATPGRLGFRYSHGLWIGADGQEVAVNAEHADGVIRLSVPADVVASTTFPAVLDPTIEAEIAVDTPVNGWTGAGSRRMSIARNSAGSEFLVVWQDDRNGVESDIFGTLVASGGAVLNPDGIAISEDVGVQDNPTVTFSNGRYVVAWQDAGNVAAARVSTAGAVTPLGNVVATGANEILPELSSRGATALLVYQSDNDVRGSIFNGLTFGASFNIANTGAVEAEPAVAADPNGNYLVTWTEGAVTPDLRGRFVSSGGVADGTLIDVSVAAGGQSQSSLSFNDTNFFAVFVDNANGSDIYGTRVSTAGAVLDTRTQDLATVGGVPVSIAAGTQNQPVISCQTGACLVAWSDRRAVTTNGFDVFAQVLDSSFAAAGGEISLATFIRDQRTPALQTAASGWLGGWHDDRHGGAVAVLAARIDNGGGVTDPNGVLLATGNNRQGSPTVAENATNWLVGWSDSRQFGADIRGMRVRSDGLNQDSSSRPISTEDGQQSSPDGGRLGARFLFAWQDTRDGNADIYAARVETTGVLTDLTGIAIATDLADQITPELASDGANALIVWADRRNGGFDIYGALLDVNGNVTISDIQICSINGDQLRPSVAYDPTSAMYLVAWSDSRGATSDIYGARIDQAGTVLDPCGVAISDAANPQHNPDVGFGGGRFFVAWEDRRNGLPDIFGARVTANGAGVTVHEPAGIPISTAAGAQTEPVVVFAQNSYILAWTDERDFGINSSDVYGGQVSTLGVPAANYPISVTNETEAVPALSQSGEGQPNFVLVAYTRRVSALRSTRVFHRRIVSGTTSGQPCGGAGACESGFCVDGRCCDTACGGGNTSDCQACSVTRGAVVDGTCAPVKAGRICRNYATVFCDRRELCDGIAIVCPPDIGRRQGQVCNSGTMTVCPANDVSGAPHVCP